MIFKNNKGDVNIIGLIIGVLVIGLFFGIHAAIIDSFKTEYDISEYNRSSFQTFDQLVNLSNNIENTAEDIDVIGSDPGWFDFFSGMFNKLTTPFKFTYRTFKTAANMGSEAVNKLNLLPIFDEFIITLLTVLVIIGVVMFEIYLGKRK